MELSPDASSPLPPPPAAVSPEAENLARIRSILFGQQVNTFEQRFDALEAELVARFDALQQALSDRTDALSASLDRSTEALDARLVALSSDTSARFHAQHAAQEASAEALRRALAEAEAKRADAGAAHDAALAAAVVAQQTALADSDAALRATLAETVRRHETALAEAQHAASERAEAQDAAVAELSATVDRLTTALSREKTDRDFLARLFEQAALQLRGTDATD